MRVRTEEKRGSVTLFALFVVGSAGAPTVVGEVVPAGAVGVKGETGGVVGGTTGGITGGIIGGTMGGTIGGTKGGMIGGTTGGIIGGIEEPPPPAGWQAEVVKPTSLP